MFGPGDGLAAAAVVEERVDRLLEHAALVADDDLGRVELEQALQAVVAVDDAAIEIVEIAGREAAAVEGNERAQIRREHRDDREHHPLGPVAALAEGLDDLEALDDLLALGLAGRACASRWRSVSLSVWTSTCLSISRTASPPMPAENLSSPYSSTSCM